jgi:hypothetical protein
MTRDKSVACEVITSRIVCFVPLTFSHASIFLHLSRMMPSTASMKALILSDFDFSANACAPWQRLSNASMSFLSLGCPTVSHLNQTEGADFARATSCPSVL